MFICFSTVLGFNQQKKSIENRFFFMFLTWEGNRQYNEHIIDAMLWKLLSCSMSAYENSIQQVEEKLIVKFVRFCDIIFISFINNSLWHWTWIN